MVAPGASWMPIGELSRRVGVSSDLLRKWERRYGLLAPVRTHGNQRLYSQVDEARLRLMLRHVGEGVPAAQAAELASAARFRISVTPQPTARRGQAEADRAEMLAALERFDETMAEQVLDKLLATRGVITVIQDVVLPLLGDLGERWASAQVNVAQEHFISAFIHGRLLGLARGWDRGLGQRALLACPQNEHHTFGLISFGIALHRLGWRITYLGADTPLRSVTQASEQLRPHLVVISTSMRGRLEPARSELRTLAARVPVALAGAGVDRRFAEDCGARHLDSDPVTAASIPSV